VHDLLIQIWAMLADRLSGPLDFRFLLQPLVAAFLGIRAGIEDAHDGRPAYGWRFVTGEGDRRELLRDGWHDIAKLYAAAVAMDVIYELVVFRWVYPLQALLVAAVLAVPSYFLIRGVANRLTRRWAPRSTKRTTPAPDRREANRDGPT
jgi:hypothetical protein